jgi:hypothetical protein
MFVKISLKGIYLYLIFYYQHVIRNISHAEDYKRRSDLLMRFDKQLKNGGRSNLFAPFFVNHFYFHAFHYHKII